MDDELKQPGAGDPEREREIGTVEPSGPAPAVSGEAGTSGADTQSSEEGEVGGG